MDNSKELILRIAEAETETVNAMNRIMKTYNLPFFLFEPIIDKIHRQIIDGKASELMSAKARENKVEE